MNNEIEQLLIQLEYFIEENYKYYNDVELNKNQIKQLLDYITNLQQDNTMYAQLKDEYEEEIKDLQENNEVLLSSYKAQKDINHQQLSMVIKRDKKIKDLQQENERLKETNVYCNRTDCVGRIKDSRKYDSVYQEKEDYKSRCEKAYEELTYMSSSDYVKDYDIKQNCLIKLSNILQNGGDSQ